MGRTGRIYVLWGKSREMKSTDKSKWDSEKGQLSLYTLKRKCPDVRCKTCTIHEKSLTDLSIRNFRQL